VGKGLKTPASGPHDIDDFILECKDYMSSNPWELSLIKKDGEQGRGIYRALQRIARANYGVEKMNQLIPLAETLGIPFEQPRYDEEIRKKRLFEDFDAIHPSVGGERKYISPVEVLNDHSSVHSGAITLFGSYPAAMDAWEPGSYTLSALHRNKQFVDKKSLLRRARVKLWQLFREHDFLSKEVLRMHFPKDYNLVGGALRTNRYKSYNSFVERQLPKRYRPPLKGENSLMGAVGELFSFAHYYLMMQGGANISLVPTYPLHDPRLKVYAPNNRKSEHGEARPDMGIIDLDRLDCVQITEVKSGFCYTEAYAKELRDKFKVNKGEKLTVLGSDTPVIFSELHLHIRPSFIDDKVTDVFRGKVISRDFPYFMDMFDGHRDLRKKYEAFVTMPLRFVRDNAFSTLEDAVLEVAPENIRSSVKDMQSKSTIERPYGYR